AAGAVGEVAGHDHVLGLRVVAGGGVAGHVVAVADGGDDVGAVGLLGAERGRRGLRVGLVVGRRLGHAGGRLGEVVRVPGLVIDDGDRAGVGSAERVLVGRV